MRIATIHRPPLVAALCLLVATIALGPQPAQRIAPEPLGPRPVVVVAGKPMGDLYVPPSCDSQMVWVPPTTADHAIATSLDDVVSGLIDLVAAAQASRS